MTYATILHTLSLPLECEHSRTVPPAPETTTTMLSINNSLRPMPPRSGKRFHRKMIFEEGLGSRRI